MTKSELVIAKRLRSGDYVRGDNEEGYEIVGRVVCTTDDTVTVEDNKKREHVIMRFEAFKATRPEFEDFSMISEDPRVLLADNEVMEGNGLGADVTDPLNPVPATENALPVASGDVSATTARPKKEKATKVVREPRPKKEIDPNDHRLLRPDLTRYVKHHETKTASGRPVFDVNDPVAEVLRELNLDDTYDFVARTLAAMKVEQVGSSKNKTGCTEDSLRTRYANLNPGMQRMGLGNLLRGSMSKLGLTSLPEIAWTKE